MTGLDELLAGFEITWDDGPARGTAHGVGPDSQVVFGGQLLGLCVVAAAAAIPGKSVSSVSVVFARSAFVGTVITVESEVMHNGRSLGSMTVTLSQGGVLCCRALVVLSAPEPDLVRHATDGPDVAGPEAATPWGHGAGWWDIRAVDGADINDPDAIGPAELNIWTRFPQAPADPVISRALLAYATDGFLIGTAMRPHPGIGQALAHVEVSTTVLGHSITFHADPAVSDWVLLAHVSPWAGAGRSFGRGSAYGHDGDLIASFSQTNVLRRFPAGARGAGRSHH